MKREARPRLPYERLAEPQQARSRRKREAIESAARQVFTERGYEAATMEDVARHAGVPVGGIYLHFASKRDLLLHLVDKLLERLDALQLTPHVSRGEDLQSSIRGFLHAALRADRENYGVIRAWVEATEGDAELAAFHDAIQAWSARRVRRTLAVYAKHAGRIPTRGLVTFTRIIDRHLWALLARASRLTVAEFAAETRVTADIIYYYLQGASKALTR